MDHRFDVGSVYGRESVNYDTHIFFFFFDNQQLLDNWMPFQLKWFNILVLRKNIPGKVIKCDRFMS